MTTIVIEGELAERLAEYAARKKQPVDAVIEALLDRAPQHPTDEERTTSLERLIGSIDSDITNASTTVRETMEAFYREKYGHTD